MARHPPCVGNGGKPRQHRSETQAWLRGSLGPGRRGKGLGWHSAKPAPSLCPQTFPQVAPKEGRTKFTGWVWPERPRNDRWALKQSGFPVTLTGGPPLRRVRVRGMKVSELPQATFRKYGQGPSLHPGSSVWLLQTAGSHFSLRHKRSAPCLVVGEFQFGSGGVQGHM